MRVIIREWNKIYTRPIVAESGWGVLHVLRGSVITVLAWISVVEFQRVIFLMLFEATKDYLVARYIQTVRNLFRADQSQGVFRFLRYYLSRLTFNILFGSITLVLAWQCEFFSLQGYLHLITSRVGNSSHYLVGYAEVELIALGVVSRKHVAHLVGTFSLLGGLVASFDLAGITLWGIRPLWVNISLSVLLLIHYGFSYMRSMGLTRSEQAVKSIFGRVGLGSSLCKK